MNYKKGGAAIENLSESFSVVRSLPHGHVAAVLGTLKKLNLHNIIRTSVPAQT